MGKGSGHECERGAVALEAGDAVTADQHALLEAFRGTGPFSRRRAEELGRFRRMTPQRAGRLLGQLRRQGMVTRRSDGYWELTDTGRVTAARHAGVDQQRIDLNALPVSVQITRRDELTRAQLDIGQAEDLDQCLHEFTHLAPADCRFVQASVPVPQTDSAPLGRGFLEGMVCLPEVYDADGRPDEYQTVLSMLDAVRSGAQLPKPVLAFKRGYGPRIVDGYHRLSALRAAGVIRTDVYLLLQPSQR